MPEGIYNVIRRLSKAARQLMVAERSGAKLCGWHSTSTRNQARTMQCTNVGYKTFIYSEIFVPELQTTKLPTAAVTTIGMLWDLLAVCKLHPHSIGQFMMFSWAAREFQAESKKAQPLTARQAKLQKLQMFQTFLLTYASS